MPIMLRRKTKRSISRSESKQPESKGSRSPSSVLLHPQHASDVSDSVQELVTCLKDDKAYDTSGYAPRVVYSALNELVKEKLTQAPAQAKKLISFLKQEIDIELAAIFENETQELDALYKKGSVVLKEINSHVDNLLEKLKKLFNFDLVLTADGIKENIKLLLDDNLFNKYLRTHMQMKVEAIASKLLEEQPNVLSQEPRAINQAIKKQYNAEVHQLVIDTYLHPAHILEVDYQNSLDKFQLTPTTHEEVGFIPSAEYVFELITSVRKAIESTSNAEKKALSQSSQRPVAAQLSGCGWMRHQLQEGRRNNTSNLSPYRATFSANA